jgi:large subunit ribosomal protein L30
MWPSCAGGRRRKSWEGCGVARRLRITLVKSPIGYAHDQKDTVRRLGLRKMWHAVEHDDTPGIRGMVQKVRHLVRVEEIEETPQGGMSGADS